MLRRPISIRRPRPIDPAKVLYPHPDSRLVSASVGARFSWSATGCGADVTISCTSFQSMAPSTLVLVVVKFLPLPYTFKAVHVFLVRANGPFEVTQRGLEGPQELLERNRTQFSLLFLELRFLRRAIVARRCFVVCESVEGNHRTICLHDEMVVLVRHDGLTKPAEPQHK
jgi:hypothetical protein